MEDCVDTKYDTYIEYKFFQKLDTCIKNKKNRERIRTAWLNDKELYTDLTKTIEFEFMHYSLHDASHSINILQCIYMLLGRKKIDKLSVGDLWLLLECSYSHDIGMATCYNELKKFWSDSEKVEELVMKISYTSDADVINMYSQIKDYLDSEDIDIKVTNIFKEHPEWPLEIRKAVTYINSEYIRFQHAKRSQLKIEEMLEEESRLKIEERLYKIVGKIDYLHGTDFKEIFKLLKTQDIGFETDKIHPRFIAQLLRLGDCLDIRNNRFDYGNLHYQGGLTGISNLHYEKHKNVTHFMIDEFKVQIYIDSENIDVCQNAKEWFDIIDNQIELLMKHWNAFAPRCLGSLRLSDIDLQVRFKNNIFDYDNIEKDMRANPHKIIELLIGANLYTTNLICIREYIQNAIDATKIRIADELIKDDNFNKSIKPLRFHEVIPSDIPIEYFEKYPIEIVIDFCEKINNILEIKIIDNGIGMDKEGVKALFNIGTGWKDRNNIKKLLLEMPEWLVPTGGFGIGLLSGFLITDKINIKTKSLKDYRYNLTTYYTTSGIQSTQTIDENYFGPIGTIISMKLPFEEFYHDIMKWLIENSEGYKEPETVNFNSIKEYNLWNKKDAARFAFESLYHFVDSYIIDTVVPIKISTPSIQMDKYINNNKIYLSNDIRLIQKGNDEKKNLQFWDPEFNVFVDINLTSKNKPLCKVGYRGIEVKFIENYIKNDNIFEVCNFCFSSIDLFNKNVKDILMMNRDKFKNGNNFKMLLRNLLKKYMNFIVNNIESFNNFYPQVYSQLKKLILYFYKDKNIVNEAVLDLLPNDCYIGYPSDLCEFRFIKEIEAMVNMINEIQGKINFAFNNGIDILNGEEGKTIIAKIVEFNEYYNEKQQIINNTFNSKILKNIKDKIEVFYSFTKEIKEDMKYNINIIEKLFDNIKTIDDEYKDIVHKTSFIKELLTSKELYFVLEKDGLKNLSNYTDISHKEIIFYDNSKGNFEEYIEELEKYIKLEPTYNEYKDKKSIINIKLINMKKDDTNSIVDQFKEIYGRGESGVKDSRSSKRREFALDVSDFNEEQKEYYKPIIVYGLHCGVKKRHIVNPFCLDLKSGREEVFLDNIYYDLYMLDSLKKQLSENQIENKIIEIYNNSNEFNNLINFVYSMQDKRYTKEEIRNIYLELIKNVAIECYKDYRLERNNKMYG